MIKGLRSPPDLSPQSQSWREKEVVPPFWCPFYGSGWAPAGLVPSRVTLESLAGRSGPGGERGSPSPLLEAPLSR